MCGNLKTVVMMIFLPFLRCSLRFSDLSAWAMTDLMSAMLFTTPVIFLSKFMRSVTISTESKRAFPSFWRETSCKASQAMELLFPLPAECWMRYLCPTPFSFA